MMLNGKVDLFKYWFLPKDCRDLLSRYVAPREEVAVAKQIPIKGNEATIEKLIAQLKLKRRFRGPRRQKAFNDCIKADAERVTLYNK
jgi:hypothetical protein|tara:strand:- start:688 stop:948 length:261 start_codon:yes stop_codon:yes gene_type:complete